MSETFADLGGQGEPQHGLDHRHQFDRVSGWCRCGRRDDGRLAEGSPAWRAALEATKAGRG